MTFESHRQQRPSSYYAGVLLGLCSISTPSTPPAAKLPGPIKSPIKSSLPLLPPLPPQMPHITQIVPSSPSLTHLNAPLVRCSRRLADKAELKGGRRVYNRDDRGLKPLFPTEIILPVPQLRPVSCSTAKTTALKRMNVTVLPVVKVRRTGTGKNVVLPD